MATYTLKKCPYCHKTYETYSTYTKQMKPHSGSPFVSCKYCGGHFIDKDIKEPALRPEFENYVTVESCFFTMFMPFGLCAILLTFAACSVTPSHIGLWITTGLSYLVYFCFVFHLLRKRPKINIELKKEYMESYERLSNPSYAYALKEAGFNVPRHFLQEKPKEHVVKVNQDNVVSQQSPKKDMLLRDNSYFCKKCGKKLNILQIVCDHCGEQR